MTMLMLGGMVMMVVRVIFHFPILDYLPGRDATIRLFGGCLSAHVLLHHLHLGLHHPHVPFHHFR